MSAAGGLPYPPNKGMPPPPGSQPRRHPDFSKEQQPPYPSYNNQQRPVYGGKYFHNLFVVYVLFIFAR